MPASKPDLDTPHGRLQYARIQAGYEQAEFAKLIGYKSASGWAKVETNQTGIDLDVLIKANSFLKLDPRYYFGQLSYEEAKLQKAKVIEDIYEKLNQMEAAKGSSMELDAVTDRVRLNEKLREVVAIFYLQPGNILDELKAMLFGYLFKTNSTKNVVQMPGAEKETSRASNGN